MASIYRSRSERYGCLAPLVGDVVDGDVVGRRCSIGVHEAERRDLCTAWRRGRRDPRQTQTDGAALGIRCRDAARRDVGRPVRPRRPLARADPPRIFRSGAERSGAERNGAERRDAMRRNARCASSRAEDETTRKKLRRMHATVVRASLNLRVLVSGAYSSAKMLEFHERTLNSTGFSRATRLRLTFPA